MADNNYHFITVDKMTDFDSEIMEDVKETTLADETDNSCVLQLIEIVPLEKSSDDSCKPEVIYPVVEVKPEDLQDVKQEPPDDYSTQHQFVTVQVRFASTYVIDVMHSMVMICLCAL